jgi:CBS domain-containing protein
MISNDFSQLPVTDRNDVLVGMVSEQSITRHLFHFGDGTSMLDSPVDSLMDEAAAIAHADIDLFTLLERLENCYALVITEERKPVGILTYYDTTDFLREWSEGLIRIQNIEQTLRQYITDAFPTDDAITAALHRVFGSDREDPSKPRKSYDDLSFYNHIELIVAEAYWDRFKMNLGSKTHFNQMMKPVNQARNQLAHFRGNLDRVQLDAVMRAERWIANRPKVIHGKAAVKLEGISVSATGATASLSITPWKYGALEKALAQRATDFEEGDSIQHTFSDIEHLIEDELPTSARENSSWWSNDLPSLQHHSVAWLRSGWQVAAVDLQNETVFFKHTERSLYSVFWADVVERLNRVRPSFKRLTRRFNNFYLLYNSGKKGFYYGWMFSPDRRELWTELSIDTRHSDSGAARRYHAQLMEQKEEIEWEFAGSLVWEDDGALEHAARIYAAHPIRVDAPMEELEVVKAWAVDSIQRLADTMQPRIAELN